MIRARKELELARINDTHYRGVEYTLQSLILTRGHMAPLFIEVALTQNSR